MTEERRQGSLSGHILPTSGTMVGVCTTLVGLVKIAEERIGASRVDEYASLSSLVFLASALASYASIRQARHQVIAGRLEKAADILFLLGLVGLGAVTMLFAYELI